MAVHDPLRDTIQCSVRLGDQVISLNTAINPAEVEHLRTPKAFAAVLARNLARVLEDHLAGAIRLHLCPSDIKETTVEPS